MSWTKQDYVLSAFDEIGIASYQFDIQPEMLDVGRRKLETMYQNVGSTPANGAVLTFLNTADGFANPFWHKDSIELLPGSLSVPSDAGMQVLRATTDQGIEVVMSKQAGINGLDAKFRWDILFGVAVVNPEMAGIMLFNQP